MFIRHTFYSCIDLEKLKSVYALTEHELTKCSIGYDDKVYFIFSKAVCDEEETEMINHIILCVTPDWKTGELLDSEIYEIGSYLLEIHFLQPIGDYFLIAHMRADQGEIYKLIFEKERKEGIVYLSDKIDDEYYALKNASIIDREGNRIKSFCLEDDIMDCLVTKDGRIIASYGDRGVLASLNRHGNSGVVVWDSDGNMLWKSKGCYVTHCYALNLDEGEHVWFYYYTEFALMHTNLLKSIKYRPKLVGSSGFLISKDKKTLLFHGGFRNSKIFYIYKCVHGRLKRFSGMRFFCDIPDRNLYRHRIEVTRFKFRSSKAVFFDKSIGMIFCKDFN